MNHKELYDLLKTVRKNIRCPQCGRQYSFSEIRIRGIAEFVIFLELSCSNHMPVLATVATSKKMESKEELKDIVDSNDVIETYKFMNGFSGGFNKIFKDKLNKDIINK